MFLAIFQWIYRLSRKFGWRSLKSRRGGAQVARMLGEAFEQHVKTNAFASAALRVVAGT